VDYCNLCQGVWLDQGEFNKIIHYLKEKLSHEVLEHYSKNLAEEFKEIFSGPESLKEEALDFFMVFGLLKYKFAVQHPILTQIISGLPK